MEIESKVFCLLQKKIIILVISSLSCFPMLAQVTIGSGSAPRAGALLDLKESDTELSKKGLLLPRVKLSKFDQLLETANGEIEQHKGLIVYHVGSEVLAEQCDPEYLPKGVYVWDGQLWQFLIEEHLRPLENGDISNYVDARDGIQYVIRDLGDEVGVWMLENLRAEKYVGSATNTLEGSKVATSAEHKYWSYPIANGEADFSNSRIYDRKNTYGYRYSAAAALNGDLGATGAIEGVCPEGFHIPSKIEWENLFTDIKQNSEKYITAGSSITSGEVGKAMKEICGNGVSKNKEAGGFFGILTGANIDTKSVGLGEFAYFWSSTSTATNTEAVKLDFNTGATTWVSLPNATSMASVRCIKRTDNEPCVEIKSVNLIPSSAGGYVEKGKSLSLKATATILKENTSVEVNADPADFRYKWTRNGIVVEEGVGLNTYEITNADDAIHTGIYICEVSNWCSTLSASQDVKVETVPGGTPGGDSGFTAETLFDLNATPSNKCGDLFRDKYATDFTKPVEFEFIFHQKYDNTLPSATLDNLRFIITGPDADVITDYDTMTGIDIETSGTNQILISHYTLTFDYKEMKRRAKSNSNVPSAQPQIRIHLTALFEDRGTTRKSETDIIIQDCQACGTSDITVNRKIGKNSYETFTSLGQCWMSANSQEGSTSRGKHQINSNERAGDGYFFTRQDLDQARPIYGITLVCPRPWRLPTEEEFDNLFTALRRLSKNDPLIKWAWLGGNDGAAEGWRTNGTWNKRNESNHWWYAASPETTAFQIVKGAMQLNKDISLGVDNDDYVVQRIGLGNATTDWKSVRCVLDMEK